MDGIIKFLEEQKAITDSTELGSEEGRTYYERAHQVRVRSKGIKRLIDIAKEQNDDK